MLVRMYEDSMPKQGRRTVFGALAKKRPGREDELLPCTVTVLWDAGSEGVTLMIRDDTRHKRAAVWLARPGAEQLAGLLRGEERPLAD
jgi:hypothetical protein